MTIRSSLHTPDLRTLDVGEPIADWVVQATTDQLRWRELHLRLYARPRPRWLPEKVWRRLLGRLVYLEEDFPS